MLNGRGTLPPRTRSVERQSSLSMSDSAESSSTRVAAAKSSKYYSNGMPSPSPAAITMPQCVTSPALGRPALGTRESVSWAKTQGAGGLCTGALTCVNRHGSWSRP